VVSLIIKYFNFMIRNISLCLLVILLSPGCHQSNLNNLDVLNDPLKNGTSISGTRFIDSYGRQVVFNGINKVNKDPQKNYIDSDSSEIFNQFRKWGLNCVRLGVIWAGVEPEPGKYNEIYLDKLEKQVNWAAQNGIYVLLDMHQDLFGASTEDGKDSMGDGAPQWATLTENLPHVRGVIWSDAYLISPAVQKAFDNFWANSPASDNIGIQDHYASMWKHVAERFAGNKAVIGYDIMNEPFNGTSGSKFMPLVVREYIKFHSEETGIILSENEAMTLFADEEQQFQILSNLRDPEKYGRLMDAAKDLCQQFEKTDLQSMYQHVGKSIRETDTTHILFLEHSYFMNNGISSAILPIKCKDDKPDPLIAYAGHAYDPLVDTKYYDKQDNSRVELILSRINEASLRINVPVLIGEWGALSGNSDAMASSAQAVTGLFQRYGFSNTYWSYYPGIDKELYFTQEIIRPYPPYIAGILLGYGLDHKTGLFSCSWKESSDIKAPTVIYIPDLEGLPKDSITLAPERSKYVFQKIKNSKAGYLIIPVTGGSVNRSVKFRLK
jgi:endoglycosylceramidase